MSASKDDLDTREGRILEPWDKFIRLLMQMARTNEVFGDAVMPLVAQCALTHQHSPTIDNSLTDEEQLKARFLPVIYQAEKMSELLKDKKTYSLPVQQRAQLQKLYVEFRNACAENCGIPTGWEKK